MDSRETPFPFASIEEELLNNIKVFDILQYTNGLSLFYSQVSRHDL